MAFYEDDYWGPDDSMMASVLMHTHSFRMSIPRAEEDDPVRAKSVEESLKRIRLEERKRRRRERAKNKRGSV
jgi:hypothetical protein